VLPVSVSDTTPPAAATDADGVELGVEPEPLLPHAAASMTSGTMAATAQAVRILVVTGEYSFSYAR
jgi:hypothetical protein